MVYVYGLLARCGAGRGRGWRDDSIMRHVTRGYLLFPLRTFPLAPVQAREGTPSAITMMEGTIPLSDQ